MSGQESRRKMAASAPFPHIIIECMLSKKYFYGKSVLFSHRMSLKCTTEKVAPMSRTIMKRNSIKTARHASVSRLRFVHKGEFPELFPQYIMGVCCVTQYIYDAMFASIA